MRTSTVLAALASLPACAGFAALPQLPLRGSPAASAGLQRAGVTSVKMEALDPVVVQGGVAFLGGIGAAVGILYTIEQQGVKSAERMDEQLRTKLESKVDGGDAENLFSGSDQTIDDLIANMEAAQTGKKPDEVKKVAKKVKVPEDDDDGW